MFRTLLKTMITLPLALYVSVETWLWVQRTADEADDWQDDAWEEEQ